MTRGIPMLDPKRDLKGATPLKLARALFRPLLGPCAGRKPAVGDQEGRKDEGDGTERPSNMKSPTIR